MTLLPQAFSNPSDQSWQFRLESPKRMSVNPNPARSDDEARQEIAFRQFVLVPGERLLLRNGRPVNLGSRAFDLLKILVEARGSIVSKEEILRTVWPTTIVEESNLRLQITSLRKALDGDRDLVKTVPGRGYLFVAELPGTDRHTAPARAVIPTSSAAPDSASLQNSDRSEDEGLRHLLLALGHQEAHSFDIQLPASLETREILRSLLHSAVDQMWDVLLRHEQAGRPALSA